MMLTALLLLPLLSGGGSAEVIGGERQIDPSRYVLLAKNSVSLAAGAALVSVLLAIPGALTAMRLERKWGGALLCIAAIPLFVAPAVVAVGAIRLFGPTGFLTDLITGGQATFPVAEQIRGGPQKVSGSPIYSIWGGALTLGWALGPLALLGLSAALNRNNEECERAAMLDGSGFSTLMRITLRAGIPGLLAGAGLVFLLALTEFGVPESLRSLPVLVSEVYVQAGVFFDFRAALIAGLIIGVAGIVIWGIWVCLLPGNGFGIFDDGGSPLGEGERLLVYGREGLGIHALRIAGWVACILPGAGLLVILFLTATGPSGPLPVWRATFATAWEELVFTCVLSGICAVVCSVVGFTLGYSLWRSRLAVYWRGLICVGFILPGPVIGASVQYMLRRPPGSLPLGIDDVLAWLSSTHIPLLLVWTIKFAPVVALLVEALLRQVPFGLVEAMRLEGAGRLRLVRGLLVPLVWPGIVGGGLAVYALTLGEAGASVLLLPPGKTTLGVRLLTLMHYAPTGQVSALCLLIVLPGLLAFSLGLWAWSKRPRPSSQRSM